MARILYGNETSIIITSGILPSDCLQTGKWVQGWLVYICYEDQNVSQILLCLQLVTVTDAAMLLRQSQRPCDRSTIVNSEILVLVTLKYDVVFNNWITNVAFFLTVHQTFF